MTILLSAGAASAASAISLSALLQEGTSTSTPPLPPATVQARVERKVRETTGGRPVLMPSDPPVVVEVDEIFVVPPDVAEDATYTASSSNPMVAVAEYRNPVVVTPVGPGTAVITVTSQIGSNAPVSSSFTVTVAADPTPVPAIPLVGQGLLAAFLLGLGAWLRYRRR